MRTASNHIVTKRPRRRCPSPSRLARESSARERRSLSLSMRWGTRGRPRHSRARGIGVVPAARGLSASGSREHDRPRTSAPGSLGACPSPTSERGRRRRQECGNGNSSAGRNADSFRPLRPRVRRWMGPKIGLPRAECRAVHWSPTTWRNRDQLPASATVKPSAAAVGRTAARTWGASDPHMTTPRNKSAMSMKRRVTPEPASAQRSPLASGSVREHLFRGAVGLAAAMLAIGLVAVVGPISLVLLLLTAAAWRGCPTCWTVGLLGTLADDCARRGCSRC